MQEDPFWPSDPHGFVFLARALDKIGGSLWKDAWCGGEVVWGGRTISTGFADIMLRSMRDLPASHPQRAFADRWLRGGSDFLKLWGVAARELENDREAVRAAEAAEKLRRVERMMAALFESGALASYGRPLIGGALQPLSCDLWRSELLASRWSSFQIDLWHPFGTCAEKGPRDLHWIFVGGDSLRAIITEIACSLVDGPDRRAAAVSVPDIEEQPNARGRGAFQKRLGDLLLNDPLNTKGRTKKELLAEADPGSGLSARQQNLAWAVVVVEYPAYAKPGPRHGARIRRTYSSHNSLH